MTQLKHEPMPDTLTLSSLPLFPLGTVLYPGGQISLRIFEVRYLDMIGKCHKTGAPFGIVGLLRGSEVRTANPGVGGGQAPEEFSEIGTLATLTEFSVPQPGLMVIRCKGMQRFQITDREKLKHGLWIANVTRIDDDMVVPVPSDLQPSANALHQLIKSLQLRGLAEGDMPLSAPYQFDDCGWVANRWCEFLPLPLELKQRLMALDNPLVRLELVSDILERTGIAL